MFARSQLAVMDFNEDISLEQATSGQGDKRFNLTFSKVTKQWIEIGKKLSNQLQKMKSLAILLFLNCRKILLEFQNLIKLLLLRTKIQDFQSEFSFFNCIYFLHLSKSSTKKMIIYIKFKNRKMILFSFQIHDIVPISFQVLLFFIRHTKESLSYFLFLTS